MTKEEREENIANKRKAYYQALRNHILSPDDYWWEVTKWHAFADLNRAWDEVREDDDY